MKNKIYEVEIGTHYHFYTKYTVQADSEEEAIKFASENMEKSKLHNNLNSILEKKFPYEFSVAYKQDLLPEPYHVEELDH